MGNCFGGGSSAEPVSSEAVSSKHQTSPTSTPRKTIRDRLAQLSRDESLDMSDERVKEKKKKWLKKQASKLHKVHNLDEWARVFDDICRELKKEELSFYELDALFRHLGTNVNRAMLQLIFSLFDADGSGSVSRTEFLVSITFLSEAEKTRDVIDLAFLLFDSNRSGSVSKSEFSSMCYAMMNKAKFVLGAPFLREAFRKHLESEHATENLDFYEDWEKSRKVVKTSRRLSARISDAAANANPRRTSALSLDTVEPEKAVLLLKDARRMFNDFVSASAARQVNLADANRKRVEAVMAENKALQDEDEMDSAAFDYCGAELLNLMETDSMGRFKDKIRTNETWLADQVWASEGITSDAMSKMQFRKWASNNPEMFTFLKELQATLRKALYRQKVAAALKIQRAYRAKVRARLVQVVSDATRK